MRYRPRTEEGSVTAEFAVALPAVILVLAIALGGMQLAGEQLRLQGAVADAARILGAGATAVVHRVSPRARLTDSRHGDLVCAAAGAPGSLGLLPAVMVRAKACALSDASPPGTAPARAFG
jgi:hypothetical protein